MTDADTGPTPGPGPSGQWAQRSEREPPGGGASLALNPSIENYKRIRSTWKDPTRTAWFSVGASLSTAMDTERRSQESRSSS